MGVAHWFESKLTKRVFGILMIIRILVRTLYLGSLPAGTDQDEAMAVYQAAGYTVVPFDRIAVAYLPNLVDAD